ncbi:Trehalose-6-P synthase/phosphatase complex synthase subunit, partial [Spiromyces aspiralis]
MVTQSSGRYGQQPPSQPQPAPPAISATSNSKANGQSRLVVVSNRLPVTLTRSDEGKWEVKLSSGGLVSALSGLKKEMSFTWAGWPGVDFSPAERTEIRQLLGDNSCVPVFLDGETAELHYNGFSN